MEVRMCPVDCKYLSPKENEQTSKKEPHICARFQTRLFHNDEEKRINVHPRLIRLDNCYFT